MKDEYESFASKKDIRKKRQELIDLYNEVYPDGHNEYDDQGYYLKSKIDLLTWVMYGNDKNQILGLEDKGE